MNQASGGMDSAEASAAYSNQEVCVVYVRWFYAMRLGIDAVGQGGGIVEAAVCYTGDVSDPKRGLYDLEYYLNFVRELEAQGIHVLAIKDMAGLLKPNAAAMLVGAIREEFPNLPIARS